MVAGALKVRGKDIVASSAVPIEKQSAEVEASIIPNFYIKRPIEGLLFPSSDQLITTARKELKSHFGRDFEVPEPPQDLFVTLQNLAERDIKGFNEVYYQPKLELTEKDKFWKGKGIVKPEQYFWQQIRDGNFPAEAVMLEEGWYIGDSRAKPMYYNGKQMYGKRDYMEPLMAYLRASNKIKKYNGIADDSRFGASPEEIEEVIIPEFTVRSGAKGIVRNRKYMEFNVRGNITHPEYGKTNTWEWFSDHAFRDAGRLFGGRSGHGGLAFVNDNSVDCHDDSTGFSLVVGFPSKPQ
ncbi:MAG: hypothetical protein US43_C0044G0010 [Candidatus Levybacteria bacterium GW2011_GWA1_37_16]|nr:MAG: hypothetical protein US43_C0044G0010 [Candidatus Levybacteria bacterium GW2011_GWA1_37_16]